MWRRIWNFLTDARVVGAACTILLVGLILLGAELLQVALVWALGSALALLLLLSAWGGRRWLARRRAARPEQASGQRAQSDLDAVRNAMLAAVDTIRQSRIGRMAGSRALYELPWYMVIGNPAAGKSSAITRSGLQFPFADARAVQGVGGTRHCDWFFTTEGILLDTAGRYAVEFGDREEWQGFLDLLKKQRAKAPINGIIVAVSVAELRGQDPEAAMTLARSLRQRVQDLIERLRVFAPVYVMFTKADLVAGFAEFFADAEPAERERIWGATKPFQRKAACQDVLAFFDSSFDELCEGLRQCAIATMTQKRRELVPPGVHTFPLEFAALRTPLKAFLATLFEENPYQFRPLFRGYYFTSALQEGTPFCAQSQHVAQRFGLTAPPAGSARGTQAGYFLPRLFREVIFADKELVSQYASRRTQRLRLGGLGLAALLLGTLLGAWSWSYSGNQQLMAHVRADLDKAVQLQAQRPDLQARLEALEILQDRIEQLDKLGQNGPWSLRLGLYQGDALCAKLRQEYFKGMGELLVAPVAASLEARLAQPDGPVEDAYNALKAYLMLADKSHAEAGHLNDQLTRYWRGWLEANRGAMPREEMIHSAEHLLGFFLTQTTDPAWPRIAPRLALVDGARERLRQVVRGMSARERVYADIRARANTRFAAVTVARIVGEQDQALVQGSTAVPGAFTREAWQGYVQGAIREAANHALQSTDWVLKTASRDDLTLEGSPEQIQKALTETYKAEYSQAWQRFLQGVSVADLPDFTRLVAGMNRLGDPLASPLLKVWTTAAQQTGWDNPALAGSRLEQAQSGVRAWLRERLLQRTPAPLAGAAPADAVAAGSLGRDFAPLAALVLARDKDASLLRSYMELLSRLRARLNAIHNQGDPGPGARQLMQQTLDGNGSELAEALRFVDEQLMAGLNDAQRQALRPLLVRPLMQVFAAVVGPAEADINKTWQAQVVEPFKRLLADRYPFAAGGGSEASAAEIGQVFGPDGAIAKFVGGTLGALVVRRGDVVTPRTWADMGIRLAPQALQRFPSWMAPLGANGAAGPPQTVFQMLPHAAPGLAEYSLEIDGQLLRYRNGTPQWAEMVHPWPQGTPGARISAVTQDGRTLALFSEAGPDALRRMIDAAERRRKENGVHELRWNSGGVVVAVDLRITAAPAPAGQDNGLRGTRLPDMVAGPQTAQGGAP